MNAFIRELYEDPVETLVAHNIFVHTGDLEPDVAAFVYRSKKGRYHIVVNELLNIETRARVFLHEVAHIKRDLPKVGYILGMDMQREPFEKRADLFAREVAAGYAGR